MTCTKDQLLGLFGAIDKDEERIRGLKDQIAVIKSGIGGEESQFKEFAKDYETTVKQLKSAYKYYKTKQEGGEAEDEDYFTMCVMIDEEFADDADSD